MKGENDIVDALLEPHYITHEEREQAAAEIRSLREFVAALFDASDWPDGGDIDLCTFQDLCVAHGILTEEVRTEPCRDGCWCEEYHGAAGMAEGVTCHRKPKWLIDAAAHVPHP